MHEGGDEGVRVLNAQQLLGLLGVDAAQLSEDTHNLQEQEPVGSQRSRGFSPPFPSHQTDPPLRAHKFNLRKSKISQARRCGIPAACV